MNTVRRRRAINLWLTAFLVVAVVLGGTTTAKAYEIIEDGNVPAGKTIEDDLFLSAETVSMDGSVEGTLFAIGQNVTLNGTVDGDVILMGSNVVVTSKAIIKGNLFIGSQTADVNGTVDGSLFVGAMTLTVLDNAKIGRNVYAGAYQVETRPGSRIKVDLGAGAYQLLLNGEVGRDVRAGAEAVDLGGKIGRNVELQVAKKGDESIPFTMFFPNGAPQTRPSGLRVAENLEVGGKLTYTSEAEQLTTDQVKPRDGIVYQTPVPSETKQEEKPPESGAMVILGSIGGALLDMLRNLITILLVGALAIWLIPGCLEDSANRLARKPWPSLGYGFVTIIIGYSGLVVLGGLLILIGLSFMLITLGGLGSLIWSLGISSLSIIGTLFTMLVTIGSKIVVCYFFGNWLIHKLASKSTVKPIWGLVVGVVIFVIIRAIPCLGGIVNLLVILFGLGAIYLLFTEWWKKDRPKWLGGGKPGPAPVVPLIPPAPEAQKEEMVPAAPEVPIFDVQPPVVIDSVVTPVPEETTQVEAPSAPVVDAADAKTTFSEYPLEPPPNDIDAPTMINEKPFL